MRIDLQVPRFQPSVESKSRFAKVLTAFSSEIGIQVAVDSIELHAVGHKWEYSSEEFDAATSLPETIERIHITFSDPARKLMGQMSLGDPIAYVMWAGPEHLAVPLKRHLEQFVNKEYQLSLSSIPKKGKTEQLSSAVETLRIKQCELTAPDIRALAASILADEEGGDLPARGIRFSVSSGSLTLYEEDLNRLLENPSLPQVFNEMSLQTIGGPPRVSVRISRLGRSRTQIEGSLSWVRAKKQRLRNFFDQHQNSDPLGRSNLLLMILSLSLVWGASLLVLAAANKIYWNTEWTRILSGSALPALIIGGLAYSFLSENVVTRCWVSTVPRRPSAFRSIGGFVMIIVVTELVSLLVAALAGWFSK